jgi:hypothetical protein
MTEPGAGFDMTDFLTQEEDQHFDRMSMLPKKQVTTQS